MKLIRLILFSFVITISSFPQTLLLEENFEYPVGDLLTNYGWTVLDAPGSNPITVIAENLSYMGYPSSNIGYSVQLTGTSSSSEDDYKNFSLQNSGNIYVSFLVNFSKATIAADGDFFVALGDDNANPMIAKVFIKKDADNNLMFGLSKSTTTPTLTTASYLLNTTYLLVLKYQIINDVSGTDDIVSLYINPSLDGIEPNIPDLINTDQGDDSPIGSIVLRQGSFSYQLIIDGIRVADDWSLAPLPVELSSFSANAIDEGVQLNWRTETEVRNFGFDVERASTNPKSAIRNPQFEKIGFVQGNGNSNSPKEYSFIDNLSHNLTLTHTFYYRLKQIDTDGKFEYSKTIEVSFGIPENCELSQNYPNPFNPTTKIEYHIANSGFVSLKVYDILGRVSATLVNEVIQPGNYEVQFNGDKFPSGVYFYRLKAGKYSELKKMVLMR